MAQLATSTKSRYDIYFNENDVLTFADTRLQDVEGIIYQEKLDFNTMTSTTLTIEKVDGLEQVIETDLSKCSHVKL